MMVKRCANEDILNVLDVAFICVVLVVALNWFAYFFSCADFEWYLN